MGQVDFQDGNGRATNRGKPHKPRAIPLEMLLPLMASWMEKPDNSPGARITSGDVRPLVVVAKETSQRQIPGRRWTIVLARNNVVNLKGKVVVISRHPAVFTDVSGATPNQTFQAKVHGDAQ